MKKILKINSNMTNYKTSYISLGTNLGNLDDNLKEARIRLNTNNKIILNRISPVYNTEAQDNCNQPWFKNQIIQLATIDLTPHELLDILLNIETSMGRIRSNDPEQRYGPRCIDLDLLLYEQETYNDKKLCLPHPRMLQRAFVLVPLYDINPALAFPNGQTLKEALKNISYRVEDNFIYQ
ncbi:2-amino-4-hydroxy-6-hydroxymethyldihydropteridine diphosphokinase [Lawsonia intracellularis]|nr:7, 8-dihydro-6-hydroxymethylpterin-pyrophosphokinase [Lawsonia intracellularis N343]KAA0205154.1 2-amino-4-hydroxy-6-hydroxymethyldihydropteridine diphosphokinase [Lawsonia intracellularis]RBN32299.1 2-amino-4-hydroxy-6-hydroxymethyldihydropteridine diphosphokinase [Lawsonia intracellularis]RBN33866.1 2-amino-4-hydroxy-6-hydroxymethyldihydropteridine diphosphokinase [Lawsonia intracellularis]RBN34466.1 2-amino-4-hydroxy-6-hydroxymethyldihydropteridine diphosphokinase [Lawsonia intracellulari